MHSSVKWVNLTPPLSNLSTNCHQNLYSHYIQGPYQRAKWWWQW